jgi:hypothetical protein
MVAAIALVSIVPWLRRQCGRRAVWAAALTALVSAAATFWACFGPGPATPARMATIAELLEAWPGWMLVLGAVFWLLQTLGPRLLRVGAVLRMLREDASAGAAVVPAALVLLVPFVQIGAGHEEKYLTRCGTYALLLLVGALVFRDCVTTGRRARGLASAAVLALFCAGQAREIVRAADPEMTLPGAEVRALRAAPAGSIVSTSGRDSAPRGPLSPLDLDFVAGLIDERLGYGYGTGNAGGIVMTWKIGGWERPPAEDLVQTISGPRFSLSVPRPSR